MAKKINIFISFDLEGISGVTSWKEMKKDSTEFLRIRRIATQEINSAIRGVRKSGLPIGEILICDSHATGENLLIEELEPGVKIIKGTQRNYYMMEGLNESFDVVFFIGYHAMAGTEAGMMDHSYSSSLIYNIKINGEYVGESEINAGIAGHYGVPLGLVSGDDKLIAEVKKFFGTHVETVITKYSISRFCAKCRHPIDVQKEIELRAEWAIKKIKKLKPFRFKYPINAEVEMINSLMGDAIKNLPGLKRFSARKFVFKSKDILEFYRQLMLICDLAGYANYLQTAG
ncbi:MAG: M55 family metallopeptidase [candidate division WOR-3 bacterium]|nr:M55 family metallopeptidase [candidate division WOR-3 bacterium]